MRKSGKKWGNIRMKIRLNFAGFFVKKLGNIRISWARIFRVQFSDACPG